MSQKRQHREEGTSFEDPRPRKFPSFKSVVLDVIKLQRLQSFMVPVLEPLIRRVVKEEVDTALRKYLISMKRYDIRSLLKAMRLFIMLVPALLNLQNSSYLLVPFLFIFFRNCGKDINLSETRSLQLQFLKTISLPVFTGTRIEGEGCTAMEVALVDVLTREVVSSGLESSSKVEIVVLEGDFDGDDGNAWTVEEYANNIVRERERKKPLLSGEVIMTLKDGMGLVGDIWFTDNSSWTRSRKFRLGARVMDNFGGIRVREAISEPFVVRDHRGELYKKHHPPSLMDEVWRLEKIGKDGAFHRRLSKEKVNSVQDFLILLFSDPTRLRNILGPGMSAKMWEVTVEHAQTCVFDKKLYSYEASGSLQKNDVVFNMVGQVMGMFSNGQYVPTDKLSESEKAEARELVISAFRDREKIVRFDDESSQNMPASSCLSIVQSSSNFPSEGSDHQDSNSHKSSKYPCSQSQAASPDFIQSLYSIEDANSFCDYLDVVDPVDIRYDQPFSFPDQVTDSLICDTDSMTRPFCTNEHLLYFETDGSNLESSTDLQIAIDALMPCSAIPIGKAKWGWNVLVSVLRWWFFMKKIIMAKRTRDKDI